MEEWVLLGESGSDADSVQFVDGSGSDKGSDMGFTTVQIGGNHRAADALDSSVDDLIGGENEEEESNGDGEYGYFDLDLPALAGSKAVFGASDDCFDLNLAAGILSMGNVGCDVAGGIQGGRHVDDIDMDSICAEEDGDDGIVQPERRSCAHCANTDTDRSSDGADQEQPESCSRGRGLDDIDMESAVHELLYGNEVMTRMQYLARARKDAAQAVIYNDIDTDSSDAEEESDCSDDCTESDDDDEDSTESSDEADCDCSDDSTECSDASVTTGGGGDARNSHIAAALQRLAAAREASLPPTAPHLFFPNAPLFIPGRAGASTSTAASLPPCAPHLYFRNRAVTKAQFFWQLKK